MEICDEHGDDMVFMGRDCPACDQIEDITAEYRQELETTIEGFESEIDEMQNKIDALEAQ